MYAWGFIIMDVCFCLQVVWLITGSGVGGLLNGSLWYKQLVGMELNNQAFRLVLFFLHPLLKQPRELGGGGGSCSEQPRRNAQPLALSDSSGAFKQKHDLKSGFKTALFSFFSEQYINNLLSYRRLQIQLLILPLCLYKISAAGLSSLDYYFGNVSYYYIMFVLPIIFAFGSF